MSIMRPVIGCMPLYDDKMESYWMIPGYMKMLEEQKAILFMLPLTEDKDTLDYFISICNGFLFTGGHDISSEIYGEMRSPKCGTTCKVRDKMEMYILKEAVKRNQSVLGICRGIQMMNVCFGGNLYQDLPTEYKCTDKHYMKPPYDRISHYVNIKENTMLFDIIGKKRIGVNSYHHQAIKVLSPEFREMAVSDDGIIEAIYMPESSFIVGVQWHPEFNYKTDVNSAKLVSSFVNSMC